MRYRLGIVPDVAQSKKPSKVVASAGMTSGCSTSVWTGGFSAGAVGGLQRAGVAVLIIGSRLKKIGGMTQRFILIALPSR